MRLQQIGGRLRLSVTVVANDGAMRGDNRQRCRAAAAWPRDGGHCCARR
jgi:hypothetical protein